MPTTPFPKSTLKSPIRHPRFFNPAVARPVRIDAIKLHKLEILWGTNLVCGVEHIVMTLADWKRAEREGAVLS